MKNLYKKIGAMVLVGGLLIGSSLSSVSVIHANSKDLIKEEYINKVYKMINDKNLIDGYDKIGDEIKAEVNRLKSRYHFNKFYYAAAPNYEIERLCEQELRKELKNNSLNIENLNYVFLSPYELVDFILENKEYDNRPYLAKIIGNDNNVYKFVVMVK